MTRDPKEQRLENLRQRFRRLRARHELRDAIRRTARNPACWALGFLALAALCALLYAF